MSKTTFKCQLVIDWEFTEAQAAMILSDPKPAKALTDWVNSHSANEDGASSFCVGELEKYFGVHLAKRKVEEVKQLPLVSAGGE